MGKDLQTLNGQNKLALWAGRISECRNSGQNVKAWCRENGVCEQTYYKWQKRLFEMVQGAGHPADWAGPGTTGKERGKDEAGKETGVSGETAENSV